MTIQQKFENIKSMEEQLIIWRKRYFEILEQNGLCRAALNLSNKIDSQQELVNQLKERLLSEVR